MANCANCGQKAGFMRELCENCERELAVQREEQRARQDAEFQQRQEKENEALKAQLNEKFQDWQKRSNQLFDRGSSLYLYSSVYLGVDSTFHDQGELADFDLAELQAKGLDGWQVIGVIPRTHGIALTNTSSGSTWGESWGAGIGGNVIGVYVLLAKAVSAFDNSPSAELALTTAEQFIFGGYDI